MIPEKKDSRSNFGILREMRRIIAWGFAAVGAVAVLSALAPSVRSNCRSLSVIH